MSIKALIASNKDPKTKKVFKEAEDTIRKITQLHLNNSKIEIQLEPWDWGDAGTKAPGVLGEQGKGDPDVYLYCRIDNDNYSDKEIDKIIDIKGEIWTDHLNEFFHKHKKIILIILIVLFIELSGYGILASLSRLLNAL